MDTKTVFLKFKATPGWDSYSSKLASFTRNGQVRQVPEAVATELVNTRPENFEVVAEPAPAAGKDGNGSGKSPAPSPIGNEDGDESGKAAAVPSETKIVTPEETKAADEAAGEAESKDEDSDIVPERQPGESEKDYGKRFKAWEKEHRKDK